MTFVIYLCGLASGLLTAVLWISLVKEHRPRVVQLQAGDMYLALKDRYRRDRLN